jgi:FixJ family two-component response regulator
MSGSPKNHGQFLIAIIDDDQSVFEGLESLLESMGFQTATFSSARAFLASPEFESVSCAIIDVCMPNMNGLELQKYLGRTGRHPIPVIFITAHGGDKVQRDLKRSGAVRVLNKPFSDAALIKALKLALGI